MAEWLPLHAVAAGPIPDRDVAYSTGTVTDHAGFCGSVEGWRQAFAARPGVHWALYFEDALEFAAALYGAWHADKVAHLPGDRAPEALESIAARMDGCAGDFPAALRPLQAAALSRVATRPPLDERRSRIVVATSGSTGAPAGIEKRLDQLAREVEALEAAFGAAVDGTCFQGTVSHQHVYGLLFRVLWPLAAGRPFAARRLLYPADIAAFLGKAPSTFVTSPAHLKRLPETLDWVPARAALRAVFSSGGPLPSTAAARARNLFGLAPTEVYGSSETGGVAWRPWGGPEAAWQALPGVVWRLEGEQLHVCSPWLTTPEWCRTGDRAEQHGESFRLLGRADRVVKIEERRVSLTGLERQLGASPWLAEARALVLPGERGVLAAVAVPNPAGTEILRQEGRRGLAAALRRWLAARRDPVAVPRRWRFVDALPVDAQGKSTEARLQTLFRPLRPPPRWLSREPAAAELEFAVGADLLVFDGHFPQAPILPGVAQVDWALHYARQAFPLPPGLLRMEALKFQRVVRAGTALVLSLEWQVEKSLLSFRFHSKAGPHASGRLVLGVRP